MSGELERNTTLWDFFDGAARAQRAIMSFMPTTTSNPSPPRVKLDLTRAQLRMINSALAMYEAEDHSDDPDPYRRDVMARTRMAVWTALSPEA
jgi:hypothetical protein